MVRSEIGSAYGISRVSPQRKAIADAALARDGAFTIDELARAVGKSKQAVGTATVYRAVAAMEASGWVERVGERDGHVLYAHCTDGHRHHHHVICDGCGSVRSTACPLDSVAENSADLDGFVVTRHEVTLYGLCPSCANGRRGEA
jgi:Fur family ferric uptake transcriptional regulator